MPLMCCDACSEIDFKPATLGAVWMGICTFCKKLSTHSVIAQYGYITPKQTKSEIVIYDPAMCIYASGTIEKMSLGVGFHMASVCTTVGAWGMLQ